MGLPGATAHLAAAEIPTRYNYKPRALNTPIGTARGVFPGRVVWAHDPLAARWGGQVEAQSGHWWQDTITDQKRVDAMLSNTLRSLTGTANDKGAWSKMFLYYNEQARGLHRSYLPGEVVAVKVNLNNSSAAGPGNIVNVSPQVCLAMVRQLVVQAHVNPSDIVIYDARRNIYPALLTKVWSKFPEVRFVQWDAPVAPQPKNPSTGDYRGLEQAQWIESVSYSVNQNEYYDAKLIPRQIKDATYLVNVALIKAHSYPHAAAEGGDEGQTGVTMTGKNHFGSIKGTPELHGAINTNRQGTAHAYSPIVDLAASPISAPKRSCMSWTVSIAPAATNPIRCIFLTLPSTTASPHTKTRNGHQAYWHRWMAWRSIPWDSIFSFRNRRTMKMNRVTHAL